MLQAKTRAGKQRGLVQSSKRRTERRLRTREAERWPEPVNSDGKSKSKNGGLRGECKLASACKLLDASIRLVITIGPIRLQPPRSYASRTREDKCTDTRANTRARTHECTPHTHRDSRWSRLSSSSRGRERSASVRSTWGQTVRRLRGQIKRVWNIA